MGGIVKGGLTPKMILEEVCYNNYNPQFYSPPNNINNNDGFDDYFVDQLFNFNNNNNKEEEIISDIEQQKSMDSCIGLRFDSQQQQKQQEFYEGKDTSLFTPPIDTAEEAHLEWLSNFIGESFGPYSTPFPPGYIFPKLKPRPEPKPDLEDEATSPFSFGTARSRKRARAGDGQVLGPSLSPARYQATTKREIPGLAAQRRCTHCGVCKTPQWREGPNGAKTLCNACGVRFRSGRLLPEYRPACSPTFSRELHSNIHRKVLEMRLTKDNENF